MCTEDDQICTEGDDMTAHDVLEYVILIGVAIVVANLVVGWFQDHINIK